MTHSTISHSSKKILVVDDTPDNLMLIQGILQAEGHEIILAKDGKTALALVEESPPQLILLDVMMPGMDGFEVTKRLRSNKTLPFIPILLITAYDQPSAVRGLDSGADDFIRKPVDVDELLARVRSLLRLKHSVDEREQMARQREDFVSRLTHDLRTPLVAADRVLELMQQGALGELSPGLHEAIATMSRSHRNLLEMVNTLLEVYRYEAARKTFNFSQIDLHTLAKEVIEELSPLAEAKGLALRVEEHHGMIPMQVRGDRLELRRLLTNIIGNGIKFTDRGSITVELEREASSKTDAWVVVSVRDTGVGISEADQKWLFNRFRTGSHRGSGSGLGLHLSRQIVETHGGTISVRSEQGQGSLFIVCLPALNSNESVGKHR